MKTTLIAATAMLAVISGSTSAFAYTGEIDLTKQYEASKKADAIAAVGRTDTGKRYSNAITAYKANPNPATLAELKSAEKAWSAAVSRNTGNWRDAYGSGDNQTTTTGTATGNGSGAATPDYR